MHSVDLYYRRDRIQWKNKTTVLTIRDSKKWSSRIELKSHDTFEYSMLFNKMVFCFLFPKGSNDYSGISTNFDPIPAGKIEEYL